MCMICGDNSSDQVIDHSITHPFELREGSDMECQTCGRHVSIHPDKMDYLQKHTMEQIIEFGHQVRFIFGGDFEFWYSVGRSVKDRPEILVTGPLGRSVGQYIVNRVAELDDENPLSADMELDSVLQDYPVRLVAVRDLEEAEMFGVTENFGTDDTWALQVVWPDTDGHFPGDPDYDERFLQPVFN